MSRKANSARVIVTMPIKLREQVERLAKDDDTSLSAITRRALRRYVEAECGKASK